MEGLQDYRSLVVIILSLVLSSLAIQSVSAPYYSIRFDKSTYARGDSGECTVELWMMVGDPTKDQDPLKYTKAGLTFSFRTYTWTGEVILNPGDQTHKTITITFTIPKDTPDGDYPGEVNLTYQVQKQGEWKGPYKYNPRGDKITVKGGELVEDSTLIPGFPWESILVACILGIGVLLSRRAASSNPHPSSRFIQI